MVTGLNHITFAVLDLARSFDFYVCVLGCKPEARWENGAYLTAGDTWLALLRSDEPQPIVRPDYSHIAFSCPPDDFRRLSKAIDDAGGAAWSENVSEGDSHYFLDPDGHKLEIHVGDLQSRLTALRSDTRKTVEFFDDIQEP